MALPEDPVLRLRCYRNALRNRSVTGYIVVKERVEQWLKNELPDYSLAEIRQELYLHVEAGGTIDEQVERRAEYTHYEFHYDLRMHLGGRHIYFETILLCDDPDDPDDPTIVVVNAHDV